MWVETYRPETPGEMVGNEEQIERLYKSLKMWSEGDDHLLLHGPPGVGKTTAVHVLARQFDVPLHEINASDSRTGDIESELENATSVGGFMDDSRIVLVDEVDNLDRGGAGAIRRCMDTATQPMVLVCNEYWDGVSDGLKRRAEEIEWSPIDDRKIAARLRQICDSEDLDYTPDGIRLVAESAGGDLRAAINDLQSISVDGEINWESASFFFDDRSRRESRLGLLGSRHVDPKLVRQTLDDFSEILSEFDTVVIRGTPGFDIVAGEWALRHRMDLEIHPPWYRDELFDSEVWETRYDELARQGSHFEPCFYNGGWDSDEWRSRWSSVGPDEIYGWVDDEIERDTEVLWKDLRIEKSNLEMLVV